uniref:Putative RING finger E3 ubiquitin ligase n=1 Tax=Marseillevirus LCMAC101 TaxID=2506602 RepID=A0A481YRE7_9VIRU|nr:MAG: putative RING finger E3 ubiquitin ligase [Marseillevirus LCMAC101]
MDKTTENIVFANRTYNTECPVCFEKENLTPLSCLHLIHLECAKNLISSVCPICNAPLEDLPEEIQNQITENEKKYKDELEQEDRRTIEELSRRQSLISRMEMVIQPPPSVEILAAIQYTRSIGIPLNCIPSEMRVNVPEGTPGPPPGTWFQITVGHAMERAREMLRREYETSDESDDGSEDESDEDDEDPFEEENKLLEKIPRQLEFNDNSRTRRR